MDIIILSLDQRWARTNTLTSERTIRLMIIRRTISPMQTPHESKTGVLNLHVPISHIGRSCKRFRRKMTRVSLLKPYKNEEFVSQEIDKILICPRSHLWIQCIQYLPPRIRNWRKILNKDKIAWRSDTRVLWIKSKKQKIKKWTMEENSTKISQMNFKSLWPTIDYLLTSSKLSFRLPQHLRMSEVAIDWWLMRAGPPSDNTMRQTSARLLRKERALRFNNGYLLSNLINEEIMGFSNPLIRRLERWVQILTLSLMIIKFSLQKLHRESQTQGKTWVLFRKSIKSSRINSWSLLTFLIAKKCLKLKTLMIKVSSKEPKCLAIKSKSLKLNFYPVEMIFSQTRGKALCLRRVLLRTSITMLLTFSRHLWSILLVIKTNQFDQSITLNTVRLRMIFQFLYLNKRTPSIL